MWRGGRCLQGRDWQECIFSRWGAPWQPGSQRWGEVQLWLHSVHHHQSKSVCSWERDVTQTRADPVFPFGSNIRKSSLGTNILAARLTNILLKKYPEKHLFTDNNKTVVNLEFHNFNVSFYPFFRTMMVMYAIQSFFLKLYLKVFICAVLFSSRN